LLAEALTNYPYLYVNASPLVKLVQVRVVTDCYPGLQVSCKLHSTMHGYVGNIEPFVTALLLFLQKTRVTYGNYILNRSVTVRYIETEEIDYSKRYGLQKWTLYSEGSHATYGLSALAGSRPIPAPNQTYDFRYYVRARYDVGIYGLKPFRLQAFLFSRDVDQYLYILSLATTSYINPLLQTAISSSGLARYLSRELTPTGNLVCPFMHKRRLIIMPVNNIIFNEQRYDEMSIDHRVKWSR
jgi:hypothetical protein